MCATYYTGISLLRILYMMYGILKKLWKCCFKMCPVNYIYVWSMEQCNLNLNKCRWLNYIFYLLHFVIRRFRLMVLSLQLNWALYSCALDTLHLFWHKSNMPSRVSSLIKQFPITAVAQDIDHSYYQCSWI